MAYLFRILGCGSSGGVPRIDGDWGACDPQEPKNRRRRCSLLVRKMKTDPPQKDAASGRDAVTNVLIDTAPDLREQLIDAQANYIDAVLYTHDHADQTHGIDDLRPLFYRYKRRIPVWMDEVTATSIMKRFAYCFRQGTESHYPAILEENRITPDLQPIEIDGAGGRIEAKPFLQNHGSIRSLGYRIDRLIYSPDINGLPQESYAIFENAALWIVDALRRVPHPTHFHLAQTLAMIKELNVKQAVLTNLHIDMDYQSLAKELPSHVVPAYDGMEIKL